jgi:hypothetical protein
MADLLADYSRKMPWGSLVQELMSATRLTSLDLADLVADLQLMKGSLRLIAPIAGSCSRYSLSRKLSQKRLAIPLRRYLRRNHLEQFRRCPRLSRRAVHDDPQSDP